MDGLTKEEEEELERQLLMSPPIMESPCPSELDTHSRSLSLSLIKILTPYYKVVNTLKQVKVNLA